MKRAAPSLIPDHLRGPLRDNAWTIVRSIAREPAPDPAPLLKIVNPLGHGRWLITALLGEETLFGLCDPGQGPPRLGYITLHELAQIRVPLGLAIRRDRWFGTRAPLSVWLTLAQSLGSIRAAEKAMRLIPPRRRTPS